MNWSNFVGVDALNHLSFILLFAANSAGTRLRLHVLAALSLAMGIAFMYLQGIASSVGWLSVLLLQNLWQIGRYLRVASGYGLVGRQDGTPVKRSSSTTSSASEPR